MVNKTENEKFLIKLMDDLLKFKEDFKPNEKECYCVDVIRNAVFFAYVKEPYNSLSDKGDIANV